MKEICKLNQNITDKFKHLDDEQYQQEYAEHCRKMNIIDSYEGEIKEVLFLSSGCVNKGTHSYKEYGLGISPDYINLESLVHNLQLLKSKNGTYKEPINFCEYAKESEYTEYLLTKINKYSKEFYNKEYFTRWEGDMFTNEITLVSKTVCWKKEYFRHPETIHSFVWFILAIVTPLIGWAYLINSMYIAYKLCFKHKGEIK